MFEVWVNQENPSIHLVRKPGQPFDAGTGQPMMNWSLLGTVRVSPEIAETVERHGMAEISSVTPFDPNGVFGSSDEPSGAQNNVPR